MGQVYVMDKVITLFNNRKLTAKKNFKKGRKFTTKILKKLGGDMKYQTIKELKGEH